MHRVQLQDQRLKSALYNRILKGDPDWACVGRDVREAAHGLIQYPAMMVPAMQRDILSAVFEASPQTRLILDPFVGSGTALTETLAAGRSFVGFDINPLAVLVARVKAQPYYAERYARAAEEVLRLISHDKGTSYSIRFTNQEKWFRRSNSIGLSRIRRAIERIDDIHSRRFMWVAMAETIRKCSNSRTSTYKLHVRPDDEIERISGVAIPVFSKVLHTNVRLMRDEKEKLRLRGISSKTQKTIGAQVWLGDICDSKHGLFDEPSVDLVLTSPPYGDNTTTVPYGQFSYLALRWIPHEDIDTKVDGALLDTTHTLDSASVGGTRRTSKELMESLRERSDTFMKMYLKLAKIDDAAAKRWVAYCRDLSRAMDNITKTVQSGGYLVWTIGQRRMRSISAPIVQVLHELHEYCGATSVTTVERRIPVKRMPTHNSISALMLLEHVCFYRMG